MSFIYWNPFKTNPNILAGLFWLGQSDQWHWHGAWWCRISIKLCKFRSAIDMTELCQWEINIVLGIFWVLYFKERRRREFRILDEEMGKDQGSIICRNLRVGRIYGMDWLMKLVYKLTQIRNFWWMNILTYYIFIAYLTLNNKKNSK